MKERIVKLALLILLAAIVCHIRVLECYPLVAILFMTVYMEEFARSWWVSFFYLWMVLFLPIAELFRYGVALLVWMVVLALFTKLQVQINWFLQGVLGGVILLLVSYGDQMLGQAGWRIEWVPIFESMLVAGSCFVLYPVMEWYIGWMPAFWQRETEPALQQQMQGVGEVMTGISRTIQNIMPPNQNFKLETEGMRQELQNRICFSCEYHEACLAKKPDFSQVLDELVEEIKQGKEIEKELEEKINKQCKRAEVLIREAASIFEKMELNMSWYGRLCEHREMIAGEIDAMAYVMEDCLEQEQLRDEQEAWHILQLKMQLKDAGAKAKQIHIYQRKNHSYRMTMELYGRWGNCLTVKEVLPVIERCMGEDFVSAEANRGIIGKDVQEYVFISKPKVICEYGVAKMIQGGQCVSGDSFRGKQMPDGRYVLALSDGMGSGQQANQESESVVSLFMQFMEAGFKVDVALRLMNAAMIFGVEKERFSTLDACILDQYTGIVDFYKIGAHVSFVKHKHQVEVVDAESLPMGAGVKIDTVPNRCYVEAGDYLVMVTDGVLEYLQVENPVEMMQGLLQEMTDCDAATFSRKIMERMMLFTGGKVLDDMTVLTLKMEER